MGKTVTILMLGGANRVSMAQQLMRAAAQMDLDLRLYSHELQRSVPIAEVAKVIVGGKYSDPGAVGEINEIIKSYKVDILLPFIDPAISIAEQCREKFPNLFIPVCNMDAITATFDKVIAAQRYQELNIPAPETYQPESLKFPAILKPRTGSASKGIIVVYTPEELSRISDFSDYLIQEYIADRDEYTVDCYIGMLDNEVKCTVPRQRIATAGGEVTRTQTCRIPALISLSKQVIDAMKLRGAVTLQFIYDRANRRFLLMEINARLGGGVICSIMAGADIARMILDESQGVKAQVSRTWRDGALMTRYFKEVMFYNDGLK